MLAKQLILLVETGKEHRNDDIIRFVKRVVTIIVHEIVVTCDFKKDAIVVIRYICKRTIFSKYKMATMKYFDDF